MKALPAIVLRTQPDRKLAELAAQGSEAAFEALVVRYRRALLAYCRRLMLSEHRSEDVVQQALLNAWSALRQGVEVREVKAWLYRITHNQALRQLRHPEYEVDEWDEALLGGLSVESDLERRMLMRQTLSAVAALPELQREAIVRTALEGHSYEHVAVALGRSGGAVRGLVYRARSSLRTAVAALAPPPLVVWAAGQARRPDSVVVRGSEALAGGGSAGGTAAILKGVTLLAGSAAVLGGSITSTFTGRHSSQRANVAPAARAEGNGSEAWPSLPGAGRVVLTASRQTTSDASGGTFLPAVLASSPTSLAQSQSEPAALGRRSLGSSNANTTAGAGRSSTARAGGGGPSGAQTGCGAARTSASFGRPSSSQDRPTSEWTRTAGNPAPDVGGGSAGRGAPSAGSPPGAAADRQSPSQAGHSDSARGDGEPAGAAASAASTGSASSVSP